MPPQSTYKKANLRLSKRPENTAIFHSDSSGKEKDAETGYHYFGARYYNSDLSLWLSVDPMADKYPSLSPYNYCAWNPMKLVDPDGMEMDWYEYINKETGNKEIGWTDYHSQEELDDNNIEGTYLGQAFVLFEGSYDEKLGDKDFSNKGWDGRHNTGYIDGENAITAHITVYGNNGPDDIGSYTGYTMSSDPSIFGVVADGEYTVNRVDKLGPYDSPWVLESRNSRIPAWNNKNPKYPQRNPGYLTGVFIHRCNNSGWAGTFQKNGQTHGVSEGCLLVAPQDWNNYNKHFNGLNSYKLRVHRK